MPPELVENLRAANLGRIHTPEARANMSAAKKGRKFSAEHKTRIGIARRTEGSKFQDSNGYIQVKCWKHPFASRSHYVPEHRLIKTPEKTPHFNDGDESGY